MIPDFCLGLHLLACVRCACVCRQIRGKTLLFELVDLSERYGRLLVCESVASDRVIYEDVDEYSGASSDDSVLFPRTHTRKHTDARRELGQQRGACEPAVG